MDTKLSETKIAIILAAGELFAEHGLEGTSIRPIAQKAGVNIAAINYHFGSKENLYTEVFRYVLIQHRLDKQVNKLVEESKSISKPDQIAKFLYRFIKGRVASLYSPDKPFWFTRFLLHSLSEYTSSLKAIVDEYFFPEIKVLIDIIRRSDPNMSRQKALIWAISVHGQIAFYGLCEVPILMMLHQEKYDQEFLDAVAEHVACSIITALGLPQPKE